MKKILKKAILLGSLVAATSVFANPAANQNYYSSKQPSKASLSAGKKAVNYQTTDITVANRSSDRIFSSVPYTPVSDEIYPGEDVHIYNEDGAFFTEVVIQGARGRVIFDKTVCPRAIISVRGNPGDYSIRVNSDLCN